MDVTRGEKVWRFGESAILWGGIGVILGAAGSLLSIRWLFGIGWALITIAIIRGNLFAPKSYAARIIGNTVLSLMVAAILILGWFKLPKPPEPLTKEDLQEAIANGVHPASENTPQPVVQANSEHPTKADITQMVRSAVAVNPNGLSNIGNDRLNKMAKEAINSLEELQRWQAQDTATDSALKERVGQTKIQDGKGGSRPMTNSEIAPYATAAEQKKKLDTEMRANTKPFMLRVCDLRAEIVSRLILLEGGDWSPHKQIDALFARIKAGEYGPNDVLSAQTSMQEIQKRFEQNRSASIQP